MAGCGVTSCGGKLNIPREKDIVRPESKSDKFHDGTATHRFYEEEEMDTYLAIIEPKAEKLEAINKLIEKYIVRTLKIDYIELVGEIMKILEAS